MATIQELESFKLSDAVAFHKELNPRLWEDEKLDPEVRNQLLLIAEDFVEYLGISNLKVRDVTISGSNAAYSYTPHSDLDLHVLVDFNELPNNEVYQELFTAKKTLYNDAHDITVRDVPVELYVQDTNNPVHSLGEYSIVHDKWIRIPKKRRANFDQAATKLKYEKLGDLIELALQSKDPKRISDAIGLIKRYRKSGLDKAGEFGPENLAYKAVRKQGLVQALHDLKAQLHTEKLSIDEYANSEEQITELFNKPYATTPKDDDNYLDNDWHYEFTTSDGSKYVVSIFDPDGYPMIAFAKQENGKYVDTTTNTGDQYKIFATVGDVLKNFLTNEEPTQFAFAGIIDDPSRLKLYDKISQYLDKMLPDYKLIGKPSESMFTGGKKGRVYEIVRITYSKRNADYDYDDVNEGYAGNNPAIGKLKVLTSKDIRGKYTDDQLIASGFKKEPNGNFTIPLLKWNKLRSTKKLEDYDPNGPPPGPEFKPTMPAGTVKVDVSDVYDWYKLGQHISNMKGLGKHDFGQGPPSTILSFGDEETEHKYIQDLEKTGLTTTDIDPVDPNQPKGMKRQKTDPAYNVNEAEPAKPTTSINFRTWQRGGVPKHSFVVTRNGKEIAYGEVAKDNEWDDDRGASVQEIVVDSAYRRKGIATKIYNEIERRFNYKLHPSDDVKPDGQEFWKARGNLDEATDPTFNVNETDDRKAAVLKIQKHLNKKYGANLDLDGKLGPLTLKSINKFMPRAKTGLADEPNKTTAVQGKKLKEAPRTLQSQVTPLEKLVQDYGYLTTFGMSHLDKQGATPEAQQQLLALVQRMSKDGKTFANLDKQKMEANRDTILSHIHSMMQYAIPVLKKNLPADKWEAKRSQINGVLTAYNDARQINEASGYIPSAKEKNDPRFKTALTVDVKPDAIKKNAKAFGFKTSRAGIPPQARPDGKIK